MSGRRWGIVVAVASLLLSSGASAAQEAPDELVIRDPVARGPAAVVAVVDSGINPYHATFEDRSRRAYKHPSTYIPGFPKDAEALHLSFDEENYWAALTLDCEKVWSQIRYGKLYWFPGTKIVGGISFEAPPEGPTPPRGVNCDDDPSDWVSNTPILDMVGHGTMTSSRAVSREYGACPECLVVMVQGASPDAVRWAGDNSDWIDLQSNSWGPVTPAWAPTEPLVANLVNDPEFVRTVEETARRHLSLWASGNGVLTRGGLLGHVTLVDPRMTPSVVMVGAHDSGYVTTWPDFPPHVVSDGCNSWAAYVDDTEKSDGTVGSGTSASTPFVAGGAARMLLEARRLLDDHDTGVDPKGKVVASGDPGGISRGPLSDGRLTLGEWKELVLKTATDRPKPQFEDAEPCDLVDGLGLFSATPVRWEDVPEGFPEYLNIGYGAVDRPAWRLASAVLRGDKALPDRSDTDAYFEADAQVRGALHGVFTAP